MIQVYEGLCDRSSHVAAIQYGGLDFNQTQKNVYQFMKRLVSRAYKNAAYRATVNRRGGPDKSGRCTIIEGDLGFKLIQQRGRCAISNVPLVFEQNADWRCSLERINNKEGYTPENTVLVCLEFNSSTQWNIHKFLTFQASACPLELRDADLDVKLIEAANAVRPLLTNQSSISVVHTQNKETTKRHKPDQKPWWG
jgi:hypothetical protein